VAEEEGLMEGELSQDQGAGKNGKGLIVSNLISISAGTQTS